MQIRELLHNLIGPLAVGLVLVCLIASPASAGAKMTSGGPVLSASVAGSSEVSAGQTVPLNVIVQNSGLIDSKVVGSTIVDRTDLPNTAKSVTAGLGGASGITVETDPQMIGDILGGAAGKATFNIRIPAKLASGTYTLPLSTTYTYLSSAEQIGGDSITYSYRDVHATLPVTIVVKPEIVVVVTNVTAEALNVGTEGYLNLTITNTGAEHGRDAVVKIVRNGQSPITPVDSSIYLGDFEPGETVQVRYKVAVSSEAAAQSYPVDLVVAYNDGDGINRTSRLQTLGVPVGGKISFSVVSEAPSIKAGGKKVLEVVYRNAGAATVRAAQARLSAVDPFTCSDDTAYLGDMAPGEEKTARFEVAAAASATVKEYALDSEIRYRDALDNSQISTTMKVPVTVTESGGLVDLLTSPFVLALIAALVIGGGYLAYRRQKGSA